ncbi:unnamed protein product, partial [Prorocentrum cordatum]
ARPWKAAAADLKAMLGGNSEPFKNPLDSDAKGPLAQSFCRVRHGERFETGLEHDLEKSGTGESKLSSEWHPGAGDSGPGAAPPRARHMAAESGGPKSTRIHIIENFAERSTKANDSGVAVDIAREATALHPKVARGGDFRAVLGEGRWEWPLGAGQRALSAPPEQDDDGDDLMPMVLEGVAGDEVRAVVPRGGARSTMDFADGGQNVCMAGKGSIAAAIAKPNRVAEGRPLRPSHPARASKTAARAEIVACGIYSDCEDEGLSPSYPGTVLNMMESAPSPPCAGSVARWRLLDMPARCYDFPQDKPTK